MDYDFYGWGYNTSSTTTMSWCDGMGTTNTINWDNIWVPYKWDDVMECLSSDGTKITISPSGYPAGYDKTDMTELINFLDDFSVKE